MRLDVKVRFNIPLNSRSIFGIIGIIGTAQLRLKQRDLAFLNCSSTTDYRQNSLHVSILPL